MPVPGRRAAEALGQAMFEDSPIGMAFLDTSAMWKEANPALGYPPTGCGGDAPPISPFPATGRRLLPESFWRLLVSDEL